MTLRIKKTDEAAVIPRYATEGDAGLDLFALEPLTIPPSEYALVRTGIALELPYGTEAQIRPRSGLALRYGVTLLNSPGTIDCGYRGEIKVLMINHGRERFTVTVGMKIAQMVISAPVYAEIVLVDELSGSKRGDSGFGSTGL
ncbi:deoxyuridine 5'-triphosphate nucleotidohydrolase [Clostridia bacterium]|nr:deoxyuridine 5'-triphosphate nucleotidohydrolase [Clostridia bacterium]